jgi:hypothetical protein
LYYRAIPQANKKVNQERNRKIEGKERKNEPFSRENKKGGGDEKPPLSVPDFHAG